ncbi:hypothetical protein [Kamptonema formosum]|uniref:hypothetical protein n=1 Tax=Kamptonema formosum TaxID=331992 RepID=UPI00037F8A1A|nr:hypothetical protein [Oscillatoria sp. PCC 10802]
MRKIQSISLGIGIYIVTVAIAVAPSAAQTAGQQSDHQGPNLWNNPAPFINPGLSNVGNNVGNGIFGANGTISPQVLNAATQLSQQLQQALANSQADRVNLLVQEALQLLNDVDAEQQAQLNSLLRFRTW